MRVNVSGRVFETYQSTLTARAGSIFAMNGLAARYFDKKKNEYYFERDGRSFEAIFVYLQCGVVSKPDKVPYKVFLEEMQFFGFGDVAKKIYEEKCAGFQDVKIRCVELS